MGCLILAGESIYLFAYDLRRDYTKPLLDALQINNTSLGQLSAMFGVLALICYFPGGWVADRFSARKLLVFSLVTTGALGLGLQTFPPFGGLLALYAAMGITSILTFWGALVKATRQWGGKKDQGKAFGILDGGRGLVSALVASTALTTFAQFGAPIAGLRAVISLYVGACWLAALMVWFGVPEPEGDDAVGPENHRAGHTLREVIRMPVVWLQALIILTAYCAYWGTFDISGYAVDAYGRSETGAAAVSTFAVWLRPGAAIIGGFLADRLTASRVVAGSFALLVAAFVSFALVPPSDATGFMLWVNAGAIGLGAYTLRGVYFAILQEANVPMRLTGTAVGVVSLIGYSPDVFLPPLSGYLIDTLHVTGHRIMFGGLAATSAVGMAAALLVSRYAERGVEQEPPPMVELT